MRSTEERMINKSDLKILNKMEPKLRETEVQNRLVCFFFVVSIPDVTGNIGILAFL